MPESPETTTTELPAADCEESNSSSEDDSDEKLDVNETFLCPITKALMSDPVYIDGISHENAYERKAVEAWIKAKGGDFHDPLTRVVVPSRNVKLIPATDLKIEIEEFHKSTSELASSPSKKRKETAADSALVSDFFGSSLDAALSKAAAKAVVSGGQVTDAMRSATAIQVWRGQVSEESGRWNQRGPVDAIAFSIESGCVMRGVGVLPGPMTTLVQVSVIRGRNGGDGMCVARSPYVELVRDCKATVPVEVHFSEVFAVEAHVLYTLEVHQTNSEGAVSAFVKRGLPVSLSVCGTFTVHWMEAADSANGTDVEEGCVPCVYLLPLAILQTGGSPMPSPMISADTKTLAGADFLEKPLAALSSASAPPDAHDFSSSSVSVGSSDTMDFGFGMFDSSAQSIVMGLAAASGSAAESTSTTSAKAADSSKSKKSTDATAAAASASTELSAMHIESAVSSDGEFSVRRGDYTSATWRWNYTGRRSALGIRADQTCVLTAVGVFPGKLASSVRLRVVEGDNGDVAAGAWTSARVVGQSEERFYIESEAATQPHRCVLTTPAVLFEDTLYTMELFQENSADQKSYFVENGQCVVRCNEVTLTFSNASNSPNGTDVKEGAFPCVYVKKLC